MPSGLLAVALLAAGGWCDVGATRTILPPTNEIWRATWRPGSYRVERRGGAAGSVSVVWHGGRQALRVEKTNDAGELIVFADRAVPTARARQFRISAEVEVPRAVPEESRGFLRLFGKNEDLHDQPLDRQAFMSGGTRMTNLYCTAGGVRERKFGHYEPTAEDAEGLTPAVVVAGAASVSEWSNVCVEDLADVQRRWQAYAAVHSGLDFAGDRMPRAAFRAALAADSDHTARVETRGGVPVLLVDGQPAQPVIYKAKFTRAWETNILTFAGGRLERAGVRLQSVTIRFGRTAGRMGFWTKEGFDAVGAADYLENAMRAAPGSLFIPTLHVDAYPEFTAEHPDEIWRRADGSPVFGNGGQAEKTTAHDPAGEGRWPWVSYCSDVWLEAVKIHITSLIGELRRRGLAKRIVGIHLAGYHDAQFAMQVADFSPCALRKFVAATGRPAVAPHFGDDYLLDPERDADAIAYLSFLKDRPLHLQEELFRHIRAVFKKPIVSAIWCMSAYSGTMGHAYFTRAFCDSPEIDILVSQQEYGYRAPGVPLGTKLPFASFRQHGKLYVNEFDYRTWGAIEMWANNEMSSVGLGRALDLPTWETLHRRAVGQMIAERAGFWYYDMGGGWFAPPEIVRDIGAVLRDLAAIGPSLGPVGHRSVALAIDEEGLLLVNQPCGKYEARERASFRAQIPRMAASSVPYDTWLLEDFLRDPARAADYRLIWIVGLNHTDARRRAFLDTLAARRVEWAPFKPLSAQGFFDRARDAEARLPTDRPGLQICLNDSFVSVHCLVPGDYPFVFPSSGCWVDVKTGEACSRGTDMLRLAAGETRWFYRKRGCGE